MRFLVMMLLAVSLTVGESSPLLAGGFKGGGRGGGGRGGGGRGGFSGGRPASMPSMGRGPSARPSVARPSIARPSVSRPSTRPAPRPNMPATRPSRPINGGMKPRPSFPNAGNRPSTLPSNRPSTRPGNRPTTLPGNRPTTLPGNRPTTRPGNRPTTLPGSPGNRPGRPSTRPSVPSLGGGAGRPTTLPARPGLGRPSAGDVGDFLGIAGGVRPQPGVRPGLGENRPGVGRPVVRPSRPDLVPGVAGRPGANRRPIDTGRIRVGNSVINNRPSWVNINRNQYNVINTRWRNQIGGLHGWASTHPSRIGYWNRWGNNVRFRWNGHRYHNRWFTRDWWYGHPGGVCRWHYYHRFNYHPWGYWWRRPAWGVATSWFAWSAPAAVWSQPVYYDYGAGGNVVYQDNSVYVDGQPVATADEFAQSAAALATVAPPASDEQAAETEWLPLGTFAMSTSEKDVEPTRVIQLAVNKAGVVAGTIYNRETDEAYAIQGQVDKDTQRVAFRFGESETTVAETGLYNLTQDEAPLLVHFGTDRVENYVLVRLEQPEEDGDESATPGANGGSRIDL